MPIKDELSPHGKVVGIYQPGNPMMGQSYVMEDGTFQPMQKFANPDEAMFSDANRPRDPNGFRIMPGVQMPKWSLREKIKDTYLDQYVARGAKIIGGISGNISGAKPINLVDGDSIDSLKFDTFDTYTLGSVNFDTFRNNLNPQKIGKLGWRIKDGKLVVPSNGSYFINYYTEFLHGKRRNISNIERVYTALYWYSKTGAFLGQIAESVNRSCTGKETVSGTTIQDLKAGEELQICSMHSNGGKESLCLGTITIMKLS